MGKTILTPTQRQVLDILAKNSKFTSFYLTGGTALSEYYLHHRLSEDLDFFCASEIDVTWLNTLAHAIKRQLHAGTLDMQQSFNRNLIYFTIQKEILKTEFTYYPFPSIEKPKIHKGIKIDSLIDIATNKFFTIYQKPTARHFIDLYLIVQTKSVTWKQLFLFARNKFDTHIDPIQLGSQLMLAQTVMDFPHLLKPLQESSWRSFFLQKAKELKSEIVI